MAGIFLIFAGFIALAFLALIMECCYAAYTDRVRDIHKVCGFIDLVGRACSTLTSTTLYLRDITIYIKMGTRYLL